MISDCMPFFSIIGIDGARVLCWKGHGVYVKLTTENIDGHGEQAEAGAEELGRGVGLHMCYMYAAYSFISSAYLYLQEFSAPKLRIKSLILEKKPPVRGEGEKKRKKIF